MKHPEKDLQQSFPHLVVLKASAGSGKTHALTRRYVGLLLSDQVQKNRLNNILAITFSNNAAREMRERVLSWLKALYFKDPARTEEISEATGLERDSISLRAGLLIETILSSYSDFGVRTIDSFMTSVYKASAVDLGFSPEFEIQLDHRETFSRGFSIFLRQAREGTSASEFLRETVDRILPSLKSDGGFPWNPSEMILSEIREMENSLLLRKKGLILPEHSKMIRAVESRIKTTADLIRGKIEEFGFDSRKSGFDKILLSAESGNFPGMIGVGMESPPVKVSAKQRNSEGYEEILSLWNSLRNLVLEYFRYYSESYYLPFLNVLFSFEKTLDQVKNRERLVFIEDMNKRLADFIRKEQVPDIFLRLGDTLYHFLVDEFQDTSPIQWDNLKPLIENALAQEGSLFVVGDTKQSIYRFRDADYRIMKAIENENPFPSAGHQIRELTMNRRSGEVIVEFNRYFFEEIAGSDPECRKPAAMSGLLSCRQEPAPGGKGKGYAETILLSGAGEANPEEESLTALVKDFINRGYRYSDIAILTMKNDEAVNVTSWLNGKNIPFISYSGLDIRKRKITVEIFSLLRFLDTPADDLSFATFLAGNLFQKKRVLDGNPTTFDCRQFLEGQDRVHLLYKLFQERFPSLWQKYFESLFKKSGYLPLYDLLSEIYMKFDLLRLFSDEMASVVRLLDLGHEFEKEGKNSLRDFIRAYHKDVEGEASWNLTVPPDLNAVNVMTIFKAKGLGFPLVIVLLYPERNRGFKFIREEGDQGVKLLKINQALALEPSLSRLYEEEKMAERINHLNALYVGFTRAEDELYLIGSGAPGEYPLNLLARVEGRRGVKESPKRVVSERKQFPLTFPSSTGEWERQAPGRRLYREGIKRGEYLHDLLSLIEGFSSASVEGGLRVLKAAAERLNQMKKASSRDVFSFPESLIGFLLSDPLKAYFVVSPGAAFYTEKELINREGHLFRIDRLVLTAEEAVVIDYKTGNDPDDKIRAKSQVVNYLQILREVYPERKVSGRVLFLDHHEVMKIE